MTPRIPWEGADRPPRRWQAEALLAVQRDLKEKGAKPLIVAATGTGKATVLGELAWLATARAGSKVVIVSTPTQDLVEQLADTIRARCGDANVGQYFGRRKQADRPVVVCCNPSLGKLALEVAPRGCHLLALDEAHQSETALIQSAIPALRPRALIGCTATPYRADSKSLGLFTKVSYRYLMREAARDGVLVNYDIVRPLDHELGTESDVNIVALRMIRESGHGPGICSAKGITDAIEYAAFLTSKALPSEAIHSKLTPTEKTARMAALRDGKIRCLVHDSMLVTGIDMPWLRWLCLRRPTATIVRLVQEVGRGLRTFPGKERLVVLDPYMLIDNITLEHGETVGLEALDEALERDIAEREPRDPDAEPAEAKPLPPVVAISAMRAWARNCVMAMVEAELADEPIRAQAWRAGWATPAQLAKLDKMAWASRYLPDGVREAVRFTMGLREELHAGEASDLLGMLFALGQWADKHPLTSRRERPDVAWPPIPNGAIAALQARSTSSGNGPLFGGG